MIETIEFILEITGLPKTVDNYQRIHDLLLKEDFATVIEEYKMAAQQLKLFAYLFFQRQGVYLMINEKVVKKSAKNKNASKNDDELKKILEKYDFVPDFIPNIQKLLSENKSIHNLKIQRKKQL